MKVQIRELPPIIPENETAEKVEKEITDLLRRELYLPLIEEMGQHKNMLKNSVEDLLDALRSGRIWFYRGEFKGKFNARISKELKKMGALWDRRQGSFRFPSSKLSDDIKRAIALSENSFERVLLRINARLEKVNTQEIVEKLDLTRIYDRSIYKIDNKVVSSLDGMIVAPKLTPEQRAKIAAEYTNNIQLEIKDWLDYEVVLLRERVERSVMKGQRYEGLVKGIKRSYGVSESKAKFLARQENNLLTAKLKEERYLSAGVTEYKWRCVVGSPNHPVREDHKELDGKTFRWDNPPITNKATGARNHPGCDFNCRCTARPIVRFKSEK